MIAETVLLSKLKDVFFLLTMRHNQITQTNWSIYFKIDNCSTQKFVSIFDIEDSQMIRQLRHQNERAQGQHRRIMDANSYDLDVGNLDTSEGQRDDP